MRKRGSVSVFLALILMCMISLTMLMLESARTSGARWQAQNIAVAGVDSLFSEYNIKLWKRYKICLLEYIDDNDIKECLNTYASSYNTVAGNYFLSFPDFDINEKKMITDEGGAYLEKEITELMKYNIPIINNIFSAPDTLLSDAESADSSSKLASDFDDISEYALDLEERMKKITEKLSDISKKYEEAREDISSERADDFVRKADDILKAIGGLGKEIGKYKKEAEKTRKKIEDVYGRDEDFEKVKDEAKDSLETTRNAYDMYKTEHEKRLAELDALLAQYEGQKQAIQTCIDTAEEISKLESDNDEENDRSSEIADLYEMLKNDWELIDIKKELPSSEIDEEKKQKLYDLKKLIDEGLLELVLPKDRQLSELSIQDEAELPSKFKTKRSSTLKKADLKDRVIINEYMDIFLNDFTDNKSNSLSYEKEYLIAGKGSDRDNLGETLSQLLLLRAGLNYLHIIKDSKKLDEAKVLATTIMGMCALPELTFLLEFFIISLWSFAEAVIDIKKLLSGAEVPFIKQAKDFELRAEDILSLQSRLDSIGSEEKEKEGKEFFTYNTYLKILLLMQNQEDVNYRFMDIVQMNMKKEDNNIKMRNMLYALDVKMNIESSRFFSAFVYEDGFNLDEFKIEVNTQRAY